MSPLSASGRFIAPNIPIRIWIGIFLGSFIRLYSRIRTLQVRLWESNSKAITNRVKMGSFEQLSIIMSERFWGIFIEYDHYLNLFIIVFISSYLQYIPVNIFFAMRADNIANATVQPGSAESTSTVISALKFAPNSPHQCHFFSLYSPKKPWRTPLRPILVPRA